MELIKSFFRIVKSVILSVFLICIVIFMVNNRDDVTIHLYPLPFEIETKSFLVMIIMFLAGLLFGLICCTQNIVKRIFTGFHDRRKIKKLEKEVARTPAKS